MTAASFLLGSPFGVILTFLGGGQGRRFTDIFKLYPMSRTNN